LVLIGPRDRPGSKTEIYPERGFLVELQQPAPPFFRDYFFCALLAFRPAPDIMGLHRFPSAALNLSFIIPSRLEPAEC
jgi:hypothetical protein